MATSNYGWNTPTVGADEDSWGDELNTLAQAIDTQVKAVSDSFPMVLLSSGNVSAVSSLDISLPANHNVYRVDVANIDPQVDAVKLNARFSINNGSTYESGASDYSYAGGFVTAAVSPASAYFGDDAHDRIVITPNGVTNSLGFNQSASIFVRSFSGLNTIISWENGWFIESSLVNDSVFGSGRLASASKVTNIRLSFSSGLIARAKWALYGLAGL